MRPRVSSVVGVLMAVVVTGWAAQAAAQNIREHPTVMVDAMTDELRRLARPIPVEPTLFAMRVTHGQQRHGMSEPAIPSLDSSICDTLASAVRRAV